MDVQLSFEINIKDIVVFNTEKPMLVGKSQQFTSFAFQFYH
jgi:hypothetical protein